MHLTGNPIPQIGLGSKMADGSGLFLLDKLDATLKDLGFGTYTENVRLSTFNMFVYTMSLMIGTAGLPTSSCVLHRAQGEETHDDVGQAGGTDHQRHGVDEHVEGA